ncbi:DMT family transporter [Exiguobacterium profundum]|uniref:DMT family transporter n=1 Tax=Exiguobacterium profundum TaxID=307643 RepID=A0ABY8B321_9BACL|nr:MULTISPECIES: DMT family transporter [Exiguobacterium]MBR2077720.1 DMT family transporter [Exiguobacterium sp.]WED54929.1 DMT family transporter [Exiguobacterium profundum]
MRGVLFAISGGFFLTLQSVANARISSQIGTWQAATLTQFTGFVVALLVMLVLRDRTYVEMRHVKPLYLSGGAFAAIILFSNMTAVHKLGVTMTISLFLIAQLALALVIDWRGWFGMLRRKLNGAQLIGVFMMIAGVILLKW